MRVLSAKPLGFVAFGSWGRPGIYVRVWRAFFAIKRTRDELFSERYGHTWTARLAGLSLTVRRIDPDVA